MTPRRLVVPLVLTASLALGGAAVAGALPTLDRATAAPTPAAVVRAHGYLPTGPSAEYGSDYGGIGESAPVVVEVPTDASSYDAVVTVSFRYRTHGPGPFTATVGVRESDGGPRSRVRPEAQPLRNATRGDATTRRYLVTGLAGGTTYEVSPGVSTTTRQHGENRVHTTGVLVTVELTPR